jgi:hypothetical protein
MNPLGSKPVAFLDDPIVKISQTLAPVVPLAKIGSMALDKQAARNPKGLAAKISGLLSKRPAPATYARN